MLLAAGQSTFLLLRQSLRLDEAQSLWQTSHGLGRMYVLIAQDVHVPLYHTVLSVWTSALGNDVATARSLSMVFFISTIPAVYALGRRLFDVPNALFATSLVALSPFMNWYGNEIRMYTLLTLLVVLNQLFFIRIFQQAGGPNWSGYVLTGVLGVYTHYFFWVSLLAQVIFFFANRHRFGKGTFVRLVASAGALVAVLVPWQLYVAGQGGNGASRPLIAAPTSADLFNTFTQFFFGFQDDERNTMLVSLWPLAVLLALAAVQKTKRISPEVGFFLLAGLAPITVAFVASSLGRPIYLSRYLIISLPALLLFLTWLFTAYGRRTARLLRIALVLGMLTTAGLQASSADTPVKEDYQAASRFLSEAAKPQDIVIISPPFTSYPIQYYYNGAAAVATLPIWNRYGEEGAPPFIEQNLPAEAKLLARDHIDAWLVLSYDQGDEKTIKDYYDRNFERLQARELSPGLTVYQYRLRYNIPDTDALINSLNR